VTATYTGGLRFEPRTVRPEGRLFIEGNAGVAATGSDFYRFAFDVGVGWELQVTRYLYLGPVVRYWHIYQPDTAARGPPTARPTRTTSPSGCRCSSGRRRRRGRARARCSRSTPPTRPTAITTACPTWSTTAPRWWRTTTAGATTTAAPTSTTTRTTSPTPKTAAPASRRRPTASKTRTAAPTRSPPRPRRSPAPGPLRTRQRVYFPVSRAQIPPYVMGSLRAVARYLIDHPEAGACGWRATPTTAARAARASNSRSAAPSRS
jgi:hypothetical protein